ncbi:MAG: AMP-binding protein [Nitrososphaerota archaeon]
MERHLEEVKRAVLSGGEPVTSGVSEWGRKELNESINETYGQTGANLLTANSAAIGMLKPGSVRKPVPCRVIHVVEEMLRPLPEGVLGQIALKLPDPAAFLSYWRNPDTTAMKMRDGWTRMGLSCSSQGPTT